MCRSHIKTWGMLFNCVSFCHWSPTTQTRQLCWNVLLLKTTPFRGWTSPFWVTCDVTYSGHTFTQRWKKYLDHIRNVMHHCTQDCQPFCQNLKKKLTLHSDLILSTKQHTQLSYEHLFQSITLNTDRTHLKTLPSKYCFYIYIYMLHKVILHIQMYNTE